MGEPKGNYKVQYAPSGRAKCQGCKELIAKGVLRLGVEIENEDYPDWWKWRHWTCVTNKVVENMAAPQYLQGLEDLEEEDQELIHDTFINPPAPKPRAKPKSKEPAPEPEPEPDAEQPAVEKPSRKPRKKQRAKREAAAAAATAEAEAQGGVKEVSVAALQPQELQGMAQALMWQMQVQMQMQALAAGLPVPLPALGAAPAAWFAAAGAPGGMPVTNTAVGDQRGAEATGSQAASAEALQRGGAHHAAQCAASPADDSAAGNNGGGGGRSKQKQAAGKKRAAPKRKKRGEESDGEWVPPAEARRRGRRRTAASE